MKKKLAVLGIFILGATALILVACSVIHGLYHYQKTVNQVTHIITGTDAELLSSSLNILTGKAEMKRLLIANLKVLNLHWRSA